MRRAEFWPSLVYVPAYGLAIVLVALLVVPIAVLGFSSSPSDLVMGAKHPLFAPALWLSLRTTLFSLAIVIAAGTPLAWWLSVTSSRFGRFVEVLVDLPVVIPPAVVGVALLQTFGRKGLLGSTLDAFCIGVPFTTGAVIMAQVVVSAPFFVQSTTNALRKVERDLLIVARTLGASPMRAFFHVAIPLALPGLLGGAALAWARSLGEFGATLLFAGNLSGVTQTMPLAIYTALESDLGAALAISLMLGGLGLVLLFALRVGPSVILRQSFGKEESRDVGGI